MLHLISNLYLLLLLLLSLQVYTPGHMHHLPRGFAQQYRMPDKYVPSSILLLDQSNKTQQQRDTASVGSHNSRTFSLSLLAAFALAFKLLRVSSSRLASCRGKPC
jgi:hypothetical protein